MKKNLYSFLLLPLVVPIMENASTGNGPISYTIGIIIAFLISGYLVYTLMKPDKF